MPFTMFQRSALCISAMAVTGAAIPLTAHSGSNMVMEEDGLQKLVRVGKHQGIVDDMLATLGFKHAGQTAPKKVTKPSEAGAASKPEGQTVPKHVTKPSEARVVSTHRDQDALKSVTKKPGKAAGFNHKHPDVLENVTTTLEGEQATFLNTSADEFSRKAAAVSKRRARRKATKAAAKAIAGNSTNSSGEIQSAEGNSHKFVRVGKGKGIVDDVLAAVGFKHKSVSKTPASAVGSKQHNVSKPSAVAVGSKRQTPGAFKNDTNTSDGTQVASQHMKTANVSAKQAAAASKRRARKAAARAAAQARR